MKNEWKNILGILILPFGIIALIVLLIALDIKALYKMIGEKR